MKRSHALAPSYGKRDAYPGQYPSEEEELKRRKPWQTAIKQLKCKGPHPYQVVMSVVFYDRSLGEGLPGHLMKELTALRRGLGALNTYFTKGFQGKPYKPNGRESDPAQATRPLLVSRPHPPDDPP